MEEDKQPEIHHVHHIEHNENSITRKVRTNPWMISSIVLAVLIVILLVVNFPFGGVTGKSISKEEAGKIILAFAEEQTGEKLELVDIIEESGLYKVTILYQKEEVPLYLTKDGKNLVQGVAPLDALTQPENNKPETSTPVEVPKSDKPVVELFVMTHCPYGTQAEKGFLPVMNGLGDLIDAKIRFVHYFMHDPEKTETPIQVCIREEQSNKYIDYLECFLEDGNSSRCIEKEDIDEDKLDDCVSEKSEEYYKVDSDLSEGYGVQGSPTLVVNGEIASSGRSPSAFLSTICGAFNEAPEECASLNLSAANPSAGFGYNAASSGSSASCG